MYERTMLFSVRIVRLVKSMPKGIAEDTIAKQLTKSATSIGANYREASHAKSPNDFAAKLKVCEGEAAETLYWLELLSECGYLPDCLFQSLHRDCNELMSMLVATTKA
jgi:four helix bundle protein